MMYNMATWPKRSSHQLLLAKVKNANRQDWYIYLLILDI